MLIGALIVDVSRDSPVAQGNGRLARLITTHALLSQGYGCIFEAKNPYYDRLYRSRRRWCAVRSRLGRLEPGSHERGDQAAKIVGVPNLIAIYGPGEEARVDEQLERLSEATAEARRRDVGYLEVRRQPQAARFRELANLAPDVFAVLLISDGAEVARWDHVVEPDDIWRKFDAS